MLKYSSMVQPVTFVMKSIFFCAIFIMFSKVVFAQSLDFNNYYTINETVLRFSNLVQVAEDTIMLYGFTYDDSEPPLQSLLTVRIDTSGNVIDYVIHSDTTDGYEFFLHPNMEIAMLSDSRIGAVGKPLFGTAMSFIIFDKSGNLDFTKHIVDTTVLFVSPKKFIEVEGGYLISGFKQKANFFNDIFVMKIDFEGEVLWERSYGATNENDVMGSLVYIDENTFVVAGVAASSYTIPLQNRWARSRIFAIDSLGYVKWDWKSGANLETGIVGLNPTQNGGWTYCSNERDINTVENWFNNRPKIVHRDSNMNLVWESIVEVGEAPNNTFVDMKPMPDGKWTAAGYWSLPFEDIYDARLGGGLYNVTSDGDLCWTRNDSSHWNVIGEAGDYLSGLTVLPSGSIIAAGWSDKSDPNPDNEYGWVIKVGPDGNVEPLCVASSVEDLERQKKKLAEIFPNPATNHVTFQLNALPKAEDTITLSVTDFTGRVVLTHNFSTDTDISFVWQTLSAPAGIYFYSFRSRSGWEQSGKLVLQ